MWQSVCDLVGICRLVTDACGCVSVADESFETREPAALHTNMPPEPIAADHIPVGLVGIVFFHLLLYQ